MVSSAPNPYQKYLKTTIETASQPRLLVMLFDAAVKKLHIARRGLENGEIEAPHNELIKVQRIFSELMVALDFEIGGELAQQLFAIYDFVYRHLVQANIRREVKLIDDILPIVEDLREGWTKAVAKYQEEERNGTAPALERQTDGQETAAEKPALSVSEASRKRDPVDLKPQPTSDNFKTISPGQAAAPPRTRYPSPSPEPAERLPQRLNLHG